MKKRVNILFQSDDNFAFMVGVAMSSLLENASNDVFYDIYYFALNLSDDSRRKFDELKARHSEVDYRFTIVDADRFEKPTLPDEMPHNDHQDRQDSKQLKVTLSAFAHISLY